MKKLNRTCAICDSQHGELLHTQKFILPSTSPLPSEYDVVSCNTCSFCYADTSVSQAVYDQYYNDMSKYEDQSTATGGSSSSFDIDRFKDMASLFAHKTNSKEISFIDIGCANGGLLHAMKAEGFTNLTGIDIAPKCVEFVKSEGYQAEYGGVFNLENLKGKKYDLICLSHVLEHIKDVNEAAISLDSLCSENGMIYIEVPDASRYSDFFIVPFYYFDCEHINHFDKFALENLFSMLGYDVFHVDEKVLTPTPNNPYPVLSMIFKKTKDKRHEIIKNNAVKDSINAFVKKSEEEFKFNQLDEIKASQTPIIVWGAGQYSLRLMANSPLMKCNVIRFVDNDSNKFNKDISGVLIQSPENVLLEYKDEPIVITSALHSEAIKKQIQNIDQHSNRKLIIL